MSRSPSSDQPDEIVVCNLVHVGWVHAPVDAALLETVRLAYPESEVSFLAEQSHVNAVSEIICLDAQNTIEFVQIKIPAIRLSWLGSFWRQARFFHRCSRTAKLKRQRLLVLLGMAPTTMFALKAVLGVSLHAFTAVQGIMHSNLKEVGGWRSRNPIARALDLHAGLAWFGSPTRHVVVLENAIRETLIHRLPVLDGQVDCLPHPLPSGEARLDSNMSLTEPVRFAYLGRTRKAKGFELFKEAAREAKAIFGHKVEFHCNGELGEGWSIEDCQFLDTVPSEKKIPRSNFVQSNKEFHFICLPYLPDEYQLVASGTLLDAAAVGKPVIAMKTPVFNEVFRDYGDIGYLCENTAEWKNIISNIVKELDVNRYERQRERMKVFRDDRVPDRAAEIYKTITSRLFRDARRS